MSTTWSLRLLAAALIGIAASAGANVASATSLIAVSASPYATSVGRDACTSQMLQGSIPLLNTLRVSGIPEACVGRQLVVYAVGAAATETPAYVGTITGTSASISISSATALSILGVSVSVDGWSIKTNWLGNLT